MSRSIKKIPSVGVYGQMFGEGSCSEWTLAQVEAFFKEHTRSGVAALDYLHERAESLNQRKILFVSNCGMWLTMRPWDKTRASLSYEIYLDTHNSTLYVAIKGFRKEEADFYGIVSGIDDVLFGIDDVDGKISHIGGYEHLGYTKTMEDGVRSLRPTSSACPLNWVTLCIGQSPEISVDDARDFLKTHSGKNTKDAEMWFEFFVSRAIESQSKVLRCEGTGVKQPFDPDYEASFHEKILRCELTFGEDEKTLRVSIKPFSDIAAKVSPERAEASEHYLFLTICTTKWEIESLSESDTSNFQPHPLITKIKWSPRA
jgi:hypothetical protein